jgi:hypothetical protein
MSKKSAYQKEIDEDRDCVKITLNSLMKMLFYLFPDDEIVITKLKGNEINIDISGSDDENSDGWCCYDIKNGIAYSFSDSWVDAIFQLKERIQEANFEQREREAIQTIDKEVESISGPYVSTEPDWQRDDNENLFSEARYNAEKLTS